LYNFDTSIVQVPDKPRRKIDTSTVQALRHSINNINVLNNKTYRGEKSQTNNPDNLMPQNPVSLKKKKPKRKKIAPKKEKKPIPPTLDEVLSFFKSENFPELEAKKFFNHFQSNGWKVGGKAPMKDWNAAAQNWILNGLRFINSTNQPKTKPGPNNKDYSEPL
jgi:hypothetical protein